LSPDTFDSRRVKLDHVAAAKRQRDDGDVRRRGWRRRGWDGLPG